MAGTRTWTWINLRGTWLINLAGGRAGAYVIAQTEWCLARRPRPGARLSYPGKKDKKISYMLSRQRYAEWLPTALNVTGCSTFSKKRGTGAGHGSRGHG